MASIQQPELNERLAAILAISQKMNSQRDLSSLLDLIAREATSLLDCERASIFLLDRERNELWSKVALGSDEILRFDARRGIAGNTALTGNTINVRDAYSDPRFYNAIDDQTGYRTRTVLAVAVRNQHGEIIGAFETLNKRTGIFSARDEESLIALASHAAVAIETAQLIGELRRNQDELTQQNAHLWREVENRYATHGIIGTGQRIQQIVRLVERIRDSVVNVLITGESGTGKELIAKALHYNSPRARQSVCGAQLRRAAGDPAGERAVRHREGRRHGRGFALGPVPEGRRRHPLPGRDRRSQPHGAGQDPARAAGARARTGGRTPFDPGRCAPSGGDQQRSGGRDRQRQFPRGSVLPHQGDPRSTCRRCAKSARKSRCWRITS